MSDEEQRRTVSDLSDDGLDDPDDSFEGDDLYDEDETETEGGGLGSLSATTIARFVLGGFALAAIAIALVFVFSDDTGSGPSGPEPSQLEATGCSAFPGGVSPGGTLERILRVGEDSRSYLVRVPAGASPTAELPVVFTFHGYGGTSRGQEVGSGLVPVADDEGFLLVSPQGAGAPAAWTSLAQVASRSDDVEFFDEMVAALGEEFCIDESQIFVTGFSAGALFASRLACVRGDVVAGAAAVAGIYLPDNEPCAGPVPIIALHGDADEEIPFSGGLAGGLFYTGPLLATAEWAEHNGCPTPGEAATERLAETVARLSWEGCAARTTLIVLGGVGHTWPDDVAGESAAERIWAFFTEIA